MRLRLLALTSLSVSLISCSSPPGSGSIDGLDIGLKTELHLKDLSRSAPPESSVTDRARSLFSNPPALLDSLRSYSATTDTDDDGPVDVKIWVLPLSENEGPGWLALVLDPNGRVIRSRIWGSPLFDEDPEAAWENYWRQFEYRGSRGVISPAETLTSAESRTLQESLGADTTATASFTRLMYEHRLAMYDNSFLIRRSMAMSGGDRVPPANWIAQKQGLYERMREIADELKPVIGDSASARYASVVEDGAQILSLVASDVASSDGDAVVERIQTFRRRTCGACHGIENHTAGEGKLRDALMNRLDEFSVRRDVFAVGLDVWPVPEDADRSQSIANAIKAVLVIAGSE